MHQFATEERRVLDEVSAWVAGRLTEPGRLEPGSPVELPGLTCEGIGIDAAWSLLRDTLLPTTFPADHPRYLAFVGGAPTAASVIADAALSAAAVYGGSELEAGAVVAAERTALRWLCDAVGYPAAAHGTFVSGGTVANLSALVTARHARTEPGAAVPHVIVAGAAAHSSIRSAAAIMGCTVRTAGSPDLPLRADELRTVLADLDPATVVAVVASAGATNTGAVDDLDDIAALCAEHGTWLHVDAAYGGAAVLVPAWRSTFTGLDRADSITIDPHKWLFTPFDCGAVLYRDPTLARAAHRQHADYLEPVNDEGVDNPADYAIHLTRRARGLPVWASLMANGTEAYVRAIEQCLATADHAAKRIEDSAHLELVGERHLSVVLFRRRGWTLDRYAAWSERARRSGLALVTPTSFAGEPVLRLCFVNPLTSTDDVDLVLDSLESDAAAQ
ncbi:aminotransferase class V-fold PLP-dependent enzyme [Nocardioides sp. zg-536]|uniref:Aminotransferase class V-fold PLP-dependent enzyme n=1 Tax=Nocardioides faecalis TaxID=2803858 RepID=A0A938Y6R2_9ACTN|nr:aminotransferase class I/II-fold pyridoxal phosphate-dependent enzyme [Nocardioides faecalis]MBM9460229.1 aminotransferase class V-fold PLP-dependent enzyme [Nocardioides faecalis]MBS4754649.1 aminotransferase class V-fold PLP-dependent enzyme [Nocardioides faecalis]QVI59981.1 aminotransferase class V-fold PLP-dependent enzyme [Nocardioides faecalis]